jgi:thymidylate synthase (FAD)
VAAAEDVRDSLGGYWGQPTPEWQAVHPRWGELPYFQFLGMVEAGRNWLESVEDAQMRYVSLSEYLTKKAYDQGAAAKGIQHRSAYLPNQLFTQEERTGFRKFARQAARSVLPNATETKIFVTVNGRAARHFLEQRGSKFADPEIRVLAGAVLDVLQKEAPNLFGDYVKTELSDGTFAIATPYEKV